MRYKLLRNFDFKGIVREKVGWLKGLEPSTTGITIRGSTN